MHPAQDAANRRAAMRLVKIAAAFNRPGELAKLIGQDKADRYYAEQHEVAECRRRAACNRDLLDMRIG